MRSMMTTLVITIPRTAVKIWFGEALANMAPWVKKASATEVEVMQTANSGREVTVENRMIPRKVWLSPVLFAIRFP